MTKTIHAGLRAVARGTLASLLLCGGTATHAELIGIGPLDKPLITISGDGTLSHQADTDAFSVSSVPTIIVLPPARFIEETLAGELQFEINLKVDDTGKATSGGSGPDLRVVGAVDFDNDGTADVDGQLLTGTINRFGSRDTGAAADNFDFEFKVTGGLLQDKYGTGMVGVIINSENSSFVGRFDADFEGRSKGNLGALPAAPQPAISLCTLVTLNADKATGLSDADQLRGDSCDVFSQIIPGGPVGSSNATYWLRVTNTGTETLKELVINAPALGLQNVSVPGSCSTLAAGAKCDIPYNAPGNAFANLHKAGVCATAGAVEVLATVVGKGQSSNTQVTDNDPAVVLCEGTPAVEIRKLVRTRTDVPFQEANSEQDAAIGLLGSGAWYQLVVRNTGTEVLRNLTIDDPALGLSGVPLVVSELAPGAVAEMTQGTSGFSKLYQAGRCATTGVKFNSASVKAFGKVSNAMVTSTDVAYVKCNQPAVSLVKQVSLDGTNFVDADSPSAPDVPLGLVGQTSVHYRLVVENKGNETLGNVVVSDARLGISQSIPALQPGESRVIGAGDAGFYKLLVSNGCRGGVGLYENVAMITGVGAETGMSVADDNPAYVRCIKGPMVQIEKQVRLLPGGTFMDADTPDTAVSGVVGTAANFEFRFKVTNIGDEGLNGFKFKDDALGIPETSLAAMNLNPGQSQFITSTTTGFGKLNAQGYCNAVGSKLNTAQVTASGILSKQSASASDPAYVQCDKQQSCAIDVDATCLVEDTGTSGGMCTAAISATTLRYTGPSIANATVTFQGKDGGSATYTGVNLEQNVTQLTMPAQNGYTVDAGAGTKLGSATTITINGKVEIIHTSCSTIYEAGKPAPLDAKTPNYPNVQKGDPSANWWVAGFRQIDGVVMKEPGPPVPGKQCTVPFDGAAVTYSYRVDNTGDTPVSLASVKDSLLGEMLVTVPTEVPVGGEVTLVTEPFFVNQARMHAVTASASVKGVPQATCAATSSVNITVEPDDGGGECEGSGKGKKGKKGKKGSKYGYDEECDDYEKGKKDYDKGKKDKGKK